MRDLIAVTALQSFLDSRRIDFDAEKHRAVHGRGERLRAAHATKSSGQNKLSLERTAKMFSAGRGERFECSLHNSLTSDVNPRTRGHLPVHGQAETFEA